MMVKKKNRNIMCDVSCKDDFVKLKCTRSINLI